VRRAISNYKSAKVMIDMAHQLDPKDPDIERDWLYALSRRQQIKTLEDRLSTSAGDASERVSAQRYLDALKASLASDQSCTLVSKVTSTETPLLRMLIDPEHVRGVGLSVLVNGEKSRLLLDTGATGILINRGMAERAGVTKLEETRIGGIGDKGSKQGYEALARSLQIGDLEFKNCPVAVVETRSVLGEDGLLGADVFEHFLVDIDFPTERLRLLELPKRPDETAQQISLNVGEDSAGDEAPDDQSAASPGTATPPPKRSGPQDRYIAPEMHSFTPVYRFGHNLLVSTKVGDTPAKLFLIDTGSIDNMISTDTAREVTKVGRESHAVLKGLSGSVSKVYTANKVVLQFGHVRQENQDMLAFDHTVISDNVGTEVSGTLGFTLLRLLELKIDYRDGLVDFDYNPKRLIHF
jgi:predicted aspartyl protease